MCDLELPVVDKDLGIIVSRVNVDSFRAGSGWYVHMIPDKDDKRYGRWRQSDKLTKWCDEELVKLPEDKLPEDVDEDYVKSVMQEMLLENGLSGCKRCEDCVPVGELVADGGYVATVCSECAGRCSECDANEWSSIPKKNKNDAREHSKKECDECGHVAIASVATA